ncbi:MAG: hypothetical protein AB7D92_00315 [Sphaerochaeta sp.]
MNKKVITLALVLLIAMSGAFAATLTINDNPVANVTATLTAIIGDYFHHGFDDPDDGTQFNAELDIEDAFTTDPVFTYRYETNTSTNFAIMMEVGDFINGSDSDYKIKILDVLVGSDDPEPASGLYTILSSALSGNTGSVAITIKPMKEIIANTADHLGVIVEVGDDEDKYVNENAMAGTYTSTVTISVATVS